MMMIAMLISCSLTEQMMQEEKRTITSFWKSPNTITWVLEEERMAAAGK